MKIRSILQNKALRNAGWLIGGNIIHKLIALVVGIWTARYLGPSNYGLIDYSAAYLTFFYSLASLGINSVIVKQIIESPEEEGETLGTTLVLQLCASVLSMLMIFAIVFVVDYGETLTIVVTFFSSLGLFFQMFGVLRFWFQARLESKYASIATVVAYVVTSLYKIVLLMCGKSVKWFAMATSIDHIVVALVLFCVYKKKNGPRLRFAKKMAQKLLKGGYPYILSGLMIAIYGVTDKFMLKHMLDETAVGYYGTASVLCTVWVFILAAIIDSFTPVIMQAHQKDSLEYKKKNVQLYSVVLYLSIFVSICYAVLAEPVIHILYGVAYDGAVMPLRIITWYVAFSYLGVARDVWIVCENCQRHLPKIYMGAAVINVLLNYIFIPILGASGAAAASLLTQISTVYIIPLFVKDMRPNLRMMVDAILIKWNKKN